MKIDYQDRIDDYLLGRLSAEERKRFEADASDDEELKEQLMFTEAVQKTTKSRNEKLTAMEEWKDDYVWEENRSVSRLSGRRILYWASGIAAAFIVGFFLVQNLYVTEKSDDYMSSLWIDSASFREGTDNSDILLLLKQKNYEEALGMTKEKIMAVEADSLDIVQDSIMDNVQKEYYMKKVKNERDELYWIKVFALLGLGQQSEALLLLDEIRNTESVYKMSADSLYNRIHK